MAVTFAMVGSAAAATVQITNSSCGQVLTQRNTYVLQTDIGPCNSDGIVINSPPQGTTRLVLDLNGHTIKGKPIVKDSDGKVIGGFDEGVGIRVLGSARVDITNSKFRGSVRDFDAGVVLQFFNGRRTYESSVTRLNVTENVGLVVGGAEEDTTEFSDGIVLIGANRNIVKANTVTKNGSGGIRLEDAVANQIRRNTTDSNGGNGIRFLTGNTANIVKFNNSTNNRFSGVALSFTSPGNFIQNNVLESNDLFGISTSFESDRTLMADNAIRNNRRGGITLGSGNNRLVRNSVTGNGFGTTGTSQGNGIFVGSGTDNFPRVGTFVGENHVHRNAGNGIRVGCTLKQDPNTFEIFGCLNYDQHNYIVNNVATGNAVNGPPGTKVKDSAGNQVIGYYDLLDSNNSDAKPADPSNPPTDCDNNTWRDNTFGTAFPECTKNGGGTT